MYRLRPMRKSMSGTQSGRKAEAAPCICGKKHKDSDSAAKFFGRYLHPYSGTDHSEERRGFRCPFRRELGCRTRLYRNARRTRGHAGQQVCAKPYRPHLPAGKRISGIRPSGALFGHSLSNKRFKVFFEKLISNFFEFIFSCPVCSHPLNVAKFLKLINRDGGGPTSKFRVAVHIPNYEYQFQGQDYRMAKLQFAVLIPQRNRVRSSGDGRRVQNTL